jgi:putative transposase
VGIAHLFYSTKGFVVSQYIRSRAFGGTYFITIVTYQRRPILTRPDNVMLLREIIGSVKNQYPFSIDAWVLLPDHMHCIWSLPDGDRDFSKRIGLIKSGFSKQVKPEFRFNHCASESRHKHRESTIWQRRFWEHTILDERDFRQHMDYVHFNPVKHGLVQRVVDWPYSTFHRYVQQNVYPPDWAGDAQIDGNFGE